MSDSFTLDSRADKGFSNASFYDAHRPSYPDEAVNKLLAHLQVSNVYNAKIIDLACGTGKFTELLAARPEEFEIIGVEPHQGMRDALLKKRLGGKTKVLDGNAGSMPIQNDWADGLIAAQAFHWFATEDSLKEIHRVLRPGAALGMIWNLEDCKLVLVDGVLLAYWKDNAPKSWPSSSKWEQKLKDIIASLEDGHPRFRDMRWKDVFEKQQDTTPLQALKDTVTQNLPKFSLPLGEEDIMWTVYLSDDAIWSRYSTLSQIANLNDEEKGKVRAEVLAALNQDDVERNSRGEVAVHGRTHLAWTSRV